MHALDIHLEGIQEDRFPKGDPRYYLGEILDLNFPVAISPSLNNYKRGDWNSSHGEEAIEMAREIVKRKGNVLGQQGLTPSCKHNHTLADPWHEFYCIWGDKIGKKEQKDG
jgi:hypothetical protein